jgi:hypothetical protein
VTANTKTESVGEPAARIEGRVPLQWPAPRNFTGLSSHPSYWNSTRKSKGKFPGYGISSETRANIGLRITTTVQLPV